MMPLHSPLSWTLVQHTVAPLTALVLLTAATVPEPPASRVVADPAADPAAGDPAATLEAVAVDLAHELRAVPADDTDRLCARDDLRVSWTEPTGFDHGAHVGTIGPAPDADTVEVNGAVVCGESTWAYMGFEAEREDGDWQVTAVPYLEESHGDVASLNLDADPEPHGVDDHAGTDADTHERTHEAASGDRATAAAPATAPAPSPSAPTARVSQSAWLDGLGPIEPYAAYEPQRSCSPTVKAGTGVLRDTLLGTHPQTRNLGIIRACHIGGRSEHKEGRAFDWGAYVKRPVEKAAVERFLTQLFATDADGNTHALARRMGVMYVVWNGQIWASHRAQEGWRQYNGPNPHVDHIHISLSWAGGLGQTSFFTQDLAGKGVLGLVPSSPSSGGTSTPTPGAPSGGTTSGGATSGGATSGTPKESPTKDDADKARWHRDPSPGPSPAPSSPPSPSPSPDDSDTDHARREAEKEQRRIEEEQRKAEERQAEQQAASPQSNETETTTPGKGNGGGNGRGGGKGKR